MPSFRARRESLPASSKAAAALVLDEVRAVISEAMLPAHFYVPQEGALEWQAKADEEISWEIYRGRLLDPPHTRQRRQFEAWNIFWNDSEGRSAEPILAVKLDVAGRDVHVIRSIYCYAWEGYHAGDNVYLSREVKKWVRELVGTIHLDEFVSLEDLRDELICQLFHAVIGCSRLPLTSVEAPLPAFSLGQLAYIYRPAALTGEAAIKPMDSYRDLIEEGLLKDLSWLEKTKLLEAVLRSISREEGKEAAELFISRWRSIGHDDKDFASLCRSLFNHVALSPYTDFVNRTLEFTLTVMSEAELQESYVDFLSYLLRQTVRHLTAYDLVTFHHRGANYPDALLLERLLHAFICQAQEKPAFVFQLETDEPAQRQRKRIRRRALRQAWIVRKSYEGLRVPDAPTSPGENSRVLPTEFPRVPEEQILQPAMRTKLLFSDAKCVLAAGMNSQDIPSLSAFFSSSAIFAECGAEVAELQELGMAVFLDRPLGSFKGPGEPDQTLMLSYEAWSHSIARRRLESLLEEHRFCDEGEDPVKYREAMRRLKVAGVPLKTSERFQRPGAVSLADAAKVADDFVLLRTTRLAVRGFLELFDFSPLCDRFDLTYLDVTKKLLIVSAAAVGESVEGVLLVFDDQLRRRLELQVDPSRGYRNRAGLEFPAAGLRVLRVWELAEGSSETQHHDHVDLGLAALPRD